MSGGISLKIAPSILSANFAALGADCAAAVNAGADMLHIDVMDGHFVPNLTVGIPVIKGLRSESDAFFDVHLMLTDPALYVEKFAQAGADLISFHVEANSDIDETIALIKKCGKKAGLVIKPATAAQALFEHLKKVDLVLVMSVEPGFGGQQFMPQALEKLTALKAEAARQNITGLMIEVDGGINEQTAALARQAGANVLVAGTAVFGAKNYKAAIAALRG